jgi:hypothetical protein
VAFLAGVTLAGAGARGADRIVTAGDPLSGAAAFLENGDVRIGSRTIPWASVMLLAREPVAPVARATQFAQLKNGERVMGALVSLDGGVLKLESPLFGACAFPTGDVARIGFRGPESTPEALETHCAYRETERPVPGALLSMSAEKLALDTPLGALELARKGLLVYAFADGVPTPLKPGEAELVLRDGSVVRGPAAVSGNAATIAHAILGSRKVPAAAVVAMKQAVDGAVFLADLPPESARSRSALSDEESREACFSVARGLPFRGGAVQEVRLEPRTTVTYRLQAAPDKPLALRAVLRPVQEARGKAVLRIRRNDETVGEWTVAPGVGPGTIRAVLPGGGRLTLDVDFASDRLFPCGVILEDPVLAPIPQSATPNPEP